jgi:transposase
MLSKRKYLSTEALTDVREFIARLAEPLRKRGIDRKSYRDALTEAGVTVPKSSLDRWVAHLNEDNSVYTTAKASGATPLLDEVEREVAAGWVLVQFDEQKIVSVASFQSFCKANFHVDLSHGSAVNYLHDAGFSSKLTQSKTAGYCLDVGTLATMMFEWAEARQRAGEFEGLLASVDPVLFTAAKIAAVEKS